MYPLRINFLSKFLTLLFLGVLSSTIISCDGSFEVPAPEEFSKKNREKLGELIHSAILENNQFQFLPNQSPYDTTVYWYIQELYNQANFAMRLDNLSPSNDRWNQDRDWEVHIIQNDDLKTAFSIPGGDFYISSGFLKLFEEDFELFYILSFEGVLMNDRHLLTRLIEEYNSLTLINIIQGTADANLTSLNIIAQELPELIFEDNIVRMIDSESVRNVCESSIFERQGIIPLLNNYDDNSVAWLRTRETYDSRIEDIPFFSTENGWECGELRNTGKYQKYVLDYLP